MSAEVKNPVDQWEFFHYKNITFEKVVPNGSETSVTWIFTKKRKADLYSVSYNMIVKHTSFCFEIVFVGCCV